MKYYLVTLKTEGCIKLMLFQATGEGRFTKKGAEFHHNVLHPGKAVTAIAVVEISEEEYKYQTKAQFSEEDCVQPEVVLEYATSEPL